MKLVDLTCRLAAHQELDDILQCVTHDVCLALNCERATLFRYNAQRRDLSTRVTTALEIEEIRVPVERGVIGWVARQRQMANIRSPECDVRWDRSIDRQTGFITRNILAAPVISPHNDRLLGVLQILNKARGSFDEFDETLLQAFASHAAIALQRAELLAESRRSQELQISIEMARTIQTNFLPDVLPRIPGYEVSSWWQPAAFVSGDYYDLVQLPDGRLGLVVADVSGHGIGPSLIMAAVRAMLHVLTRTSSDPEQIVGLVSETITPDLKDGRFITFLMVALDPHTHRMTYANAGHGPALHFSRESGVFQVLGSTGLPMGFAGDFGLPRSAHLQMEPGDLLLLATDGAIELKNAAGEMFGRRRLEQLLRENQHRPAAQIMQRLKRTILDYHRDQHPPDDITVLLLERKL